MTRKHYIALAEALKTTNATIETIMAVAKVCANDNARFDVERFKAAAIG